MNKLPDEIIQHIINYTDVIVYRHGKYIDRINKSDVRYKLLQSIKLPVSIMHKCFILLCNNNYMQYFLVYSYDNNRKHYYATNKLIKINDYLKENKETYILDENCIYRKIIYYVQ